jgi:hypothetical protein
MFGSIVLASACSWTGLDEYASEDPAAETDGGASDATAPPADAAATDGGEGGGVTIDANEAGDGGGGALQNLHPFPGFEGDGCVGWGTYKATLAASSVARTGAGSCRVCTDGTDAIFTADDNGQIALTVGATYMAEVWVRSDPTKPASPFVGLTLRSRNDNPFAEPEKNYEPLVGAPTASWQKITVTLKVTQPAQKVNIVVAGDTVANACFLMDDVALYRLE